VIAAAALFLLATVEVDGVDEKGWGFDNDAETSFRDPDRNERGGSGGLDPATPSLNV
jgi:hypothetical protein